MVVLAEDRVALAIDLDPGLLDEASVTQLREEREQPALTSDPAGMVVRRQQIALSREDFPRRVESRPRPSDRLAQTLVRREVEI